MPYINPTPNPSGAYPAPQSNPAPGLIPLTEEQAATLTEYNGFVTITETEEGVTVTPNVIAWEAWEAAQPQEAPSTPTMGTPTIEERLTALELAQLANMGVTPSV